MTPGSTYDLKVMAGVAAYLQEGHHYSVYIEESALKDQRLPDLRSWAGDGIIADFDDPAVARLVMQSRLPAVAFGGGYGWYVEGSPIPYFYANNKAVATLAADHLLERGFKHFAFCGYARTAINGWSHEREEAFVAHVESQGGSLCGVSRPSEARAPMGRVAARDGRVVAQTAETAWRDGRERHPRAPGARGVSCTRLARAGRSGGDRRG